MRPAQPHAPSPALVAAGPFDDLAAVYTSTLRNAEIVSARAEPERALTKSPPSID